MAERIPKLVRWVDLVAALLSRRFPIPFTEIVADVPAYGAAPTHAARVRMFERDKDELRRLGVPIETVGQDGSEDSAYRLRHTDFYLPYLAVQSNRGLRRPKRVDRYGYHALTELTFGADELSAIADASARVRQLGDPDLGREIESAMRKLAFDLPLDAVRQDVVVAQPLASASPEILRVLSAALASRKRVTIRYFSMSENTESTQAVDPHGLFFLSGHWYLAAAVSGETVVSPGDMRQPHGRPIRNYRVSRILSAMVNTKAPGSPDFAIPATFHLREHARSRQAWELGDGELTEAIVEIRSGGTRGTGAARAAFALGIPVPGHPDRRRFEVRRPEVFVRWILSFGGEVMPVSPPSLVESLRQQATLTLSLYA